VNPLDFPWNQLEKPKPKIKEDPVPNFIGVRNEAVRDDVNAEDHLVVTVQGLTNVPTGEYKVSFSDGQRLGTYLARLKFKHAATYAAVYDTSNLEKGRLRMSYVPTKASKILICPPAYSPLMFMQRTNVDAQKLASNMGGESGRAAPKIVEKKL